MASLQARSANALGESAESSAFVSTTLECMLGTRGELLGGGSWGAAFSEVVGGDVGADPTIGDRCDSKACDGRAAAGGSAGMVAIVVAGGPEEPV